ncbi:hypothetical protein FDP41_004326 [Naegleria fowleri]|uniref:Uncharacterized protein n=1 Tax=Naegleria fowleri TaxID=5763 RepID=A0A6A5BHN8_NAEFO|nr:uncharacterized protein FDP41_004326 [Naegleria fowleri]KAF0976427.1 hypothetical protein FDP41_004326 [Naegleria fowleri]
MSTLFRGSACFCPSLYWMITGEVELEKEPLPNEHEDLSHLLFSSKSNQTKQQPSSSSSMKRNQQTKNHHDHDISLSSMSGLAFGDYSEQVTPQTTLRRRELLVENTQEEQAILIICNLEAEANGGGSSLMTASKKQPKQKSNKSSSKVIHRSQLATGQVLYIPKSKVYVNGTHDQQEEVSRLNGQSAIKYLVVASHVKLVPRKSAIFNFFENTLELRLSQYQQRWRQHHDTEEYVGGEERMLQRITTSHSNMSFNGHMLQHDERKFVNSAQKDVSGTLSHEAEQKKRKLVDTSVQCEKEELTTRREHSITKRNNSAATMSNQNTPQTCLDPLSDDEVTPSFQHKTQSPLNFYDSTTRFEIEQKRVDLFKQKLREIVKKHTSTSNPCSIAQIQLPDRTSKRTKKTREPKNVHTSAKSSVYLEKDDTSEMSVTSSIASFMSDSPMLDLNKSFRISNAAECKEKPTANLNEAFLISDSQTGAYMDETCVSGCVSGGETPSMSHEAKHRGATQLHGSTKAVLNGSGDNSKEVSHISMTPSLLTPSSPIEMVRYQPAVATRTESKDLNSSEIHETSLTHISDGDNTVSIFMEDSPVESKENQPSVLEDSKVSHSSSMNYFNNSTTREHQSIQSSTNAKVVEGGSQSTSRITKSPKSGRMSNKYGTYCAPSIIDTSPIPTSSSFVTPSQPSQDDSGLLNAAQLLSSIKSPNMEK